MSVIWSASSRTVIVTSPRAQSPRSMRSLSRPGVATTTSAPERSAPACRPIDMPPTTVADLRPTARAYGVSASVTCWASSRVGTRTRASGRRGSARRPAVRASRARPNASVLPEPVRPRPSTSRPAREFGRVAAWIGNGSVTPWSLRAASMRAGRSSSAKVPTAGSAGVTVLGRANSPPWGAAAGRRPEAGERPAERERRGPSPERRRSWVRVRFMGNLPRYGTYRGRPAADERRRESQERAGPVDFGAEGRSDRENG